MTYVVITCRAREALLRAQLDTCLRGQAVHVETDEDNDDVTIGRNGTGTKLLRALWKVRSKKLSADWVFIIDDDAWVNCWALDRVVSCLDPSVPLISSNLCMRTSVAGDGGEGYQKVFGEASWQRAIDWWEGASRIPGMTTFYHGGGGMLLSKALWREVRRTAFNADEATPGFSEMCMDSRDHFGPLAALFQDRLLATLVNLTRKRIDVVQRPIRGLRLRDPKGELRWPNPQNDWEASGNGMVVGNTVDEKRICDLNVRFPTTNGAFDPTKAVKLSHSNANPRVSGGREQHIVKGQANLVTWHRFKRPEMFHQMQKEIDDTFGGLVEAR